MYYLTPYFQVRHQCVGHRCIMHAACVQRPSLCTVKRLALQMQPYTHTIFFLLFLILLWTSSSYSKYDFLRKYQCVSSCGNYHDQQMIYYVWSIYHRFKGPSSISCILKDSYMHNVLTYILGERERERGSIIQHRLFDGFSLEVCGPSGFSSLTLLYSPLLILLTLSLSPIGRQVFLGAFNAWVVSNAVYICVFCKRPLASSWSYTETFCEISSALCVSSRAVQRKWASHKSHVMKLI